MRSCRVAQEETARLAPDLAESLAALAHRGRVDDRQQLLDVVLDQRVEEGLVASPAGRAGSVFAEAISRLVFQLLQAPFALLFLGGYGGRKQAVQAEGVPLRLG